ncbi:MAG: 16S rRNA (cytidine(1402)-2'-O)-methyltransferase [Candidatus Kapaibacteriota bacterium]
MKNEEKQYDPGLYLIPTPIGNLEDMTIRALRLLSVAEIIACEDTRVTGQLLKQYSITPQKLYSCREHNEKSVSEYLCNEVLSGKRVCYVSDAGTPGISDPGMILIQTAINLNIPYHVLPGATAIIPALIQSGFANDDWCFMGFPPHKKGRESFIQSVSQIHTVIVLYESPYRIMDLLEAFQQNDFLKKRRLYVVREITKKFEQSFRGTPQEILQNMSDHQTKGEFVLVIDKENE